MLLGKDMILLSNMYNSLEIFSCESKEIRTEAQKLVKN